MHGHDASQRLSLQIYSCVFVVLGLYNNKPANHQTIATVMRINHSLQSNTRNTTTHTKTQEFPLMKPQPRIMDAVFSAMWFYSCHFPHNTGALGKDFFPHTTLFKSGLFVSLFIQARPLLTLASYNYGNH